MSASHTVGREFASRSDHTKDHRKNDKKLPPCMARNALGYELISAARLSKRPGSVWNCQWGHALKISSGINRKSRVSYPGPRFLSSATWPSLSKKHYNGLINQSINQSFNRYGESCNTPRYAIERTKDRKGSIVTKVDIEMKYPISFSWYADAINYCY